MLAFTVTGHSPLHHFNQPFNSNVTKKSFKVFANHGFPSFLPKEIHKIKDPFARNLALRIERLPVQVSFSDSCIMSSCIRPSIQGKTNPVVLLHGFDSSCLEWRSTYPLLEEAGLESWAVDILGWGFSDLEMLPSCDVASKRAHLYQFWKSYIKRPMILVGPSLGAAIAIDFALHYPETVSQLILIDASVYSEGIGVLSEMPSVIASAGPNIDPYSKNTLQPTMSNFTLANSHEPSVPLILVNLSIVDKLTPLTYYPWKTQVESILFGFDLVKFLDGTHPMPPSRITTTLLSTEDPKPSSTTIPNPAFHTWSRQDRLLVGALLGTLPPTISPLVIRASSHEAWQILARTYANPSRGDILQVKRPS
ncbi:hypothetical protein KSS87_008061 [Heliosperma pusillum]|nr:hypothetical protein KSS87_008061 [Heliosperma pusillum]